MLQQFSWTAYLLIIVLSAAVYYGFIGLVHFRPELRALIRRIAGRSSAGDQPSYGDLHLPVPAVVGPVQETGVDHIGTDELIFAPEDNDETEMQATVRPHPSSGTAAHLLGDLSGMISELHTLIRLVSESGETKENFGMLFRLIVEKYTSLQGTVYQEQVNTYVLQLTGSDFPFPLTLPELASLWLNDQKLQSA